MRINKLTDYGIVVMTRIAAMENDKSHTAKEISTLSKIPLPTVTRLLKTLSNEGLLNSQRGSQGGYSLAQSPATISVASIIEAFEGPIALTDCTKEDDSCSYESNCSAEEPWQKINWKTIISCYNSSTFFDFYRDKFEEIFQRKDKYLLDLNNHSLLLLKSILKIDNNINISEKFQNDPKDIDLRNYKFISESINKYDQVFS